MRHFGHVPPAVAEGALPSGAGVSPPGSPARVLAAALGATLYSPATRPALADDVLKQAAPGCRLHGAVPGGLDRRRRGGRRRGQPGPPVRRPSTPGARRSRCSSCGSASPRQIPTWSQRARPCRPAAQRLRPAEVHRGARRGLPGGAHRGRGRERPPALRHAGPGIARTAPPGDPRRDPAPGSRAAVEKYRERILAAPPRRHRLLLRLRTAPLARHDRVRRPDRGRRHRGRGQRARPRRRHRLHRSPARSGSTSGSRSGCSSRSCAAAPSSRARRRAAHRTDRARPGRAAARDRARPGQRPARQDLHPPLARGCPCTPSRWSATRSSATPGTSCGPNGTAAGCCARRTRTR